MCPTCMTTAAMVVASATSTAGLTALIVRKLRGHSNAKKTPYNHNQKQRSNENAIHDSAQGRQEYRSGGDAEREATRRDGEIQRRAGESRCDACGRGAAPEFEGCTRQVLWREVH